VAVQLIDIVRAVARARTTLGGRAARPKIKIRDVDPVYVGILEEAIRKANAGVRGHLARNHKGGGIGALQTLALPWEVTFHHFCVCYLARGNYLVKQAWEAEMPSNRPSVRFGGRRG